nr:hypothetical protein [Tanacetum cinerariifolium]
MLMKRISELEHIMANLIQDNKYLEERLDSHEARLYTLKNLDIPQQNILGCILPSVFLIAFDRYPRLRFVCLIPDTMADVNVNALADQAPTMAPPTRTNDQTLPHIRWVPIGKSNCYLDVEKSQSYPIYKIACQLDEQWFDLTKDTLRDALQITPVNNNNAFSSPSSSDALINFVNYLGYPKVVRNLSNVVTNDMFQSWKALTTIINMCLTGKTSGFERTRGPVLQILWGVVNRDHIADIQGEPYCLEYLEKMAKHQRYLASKTGSDLDSPAPKPAKATKKSKPSSPKADLRPPVTKPASSQQPEPKPAPAKSKGKKRCDPLASVQWFTLVEGGTGTLVF